MTDHSMNYDVPDDPREPAGGYEVPLFNDPIPLRLENDWSMVRRCLRREFARVAGVYELALVLKGGGIVTGYADNPDTAERLIREVHQPGLHQGVYIGLNPLNTPPSGRTLGDSISSGKRSDTSIVPRRKRLFFDIDPNRVGASGKDMATDTERAQAVALREAVEDHLVGLGWPQPAQRGSSGNGEFLVYLIDEPNDGPTDQLLERVLKGVARATSDIPGAHVDLGVHDAPRIMKLPGTVVAKVTGPGRPWRLATEQDLSPSPLVTRAQLELAAIYARYDPAPEALDETIQGVKKVLAIKGIGIRREKEKFGGVLLDVDTCLIAEEPHADGGACAIHIRPTGMTILCLADRCRDRSIRGAAAYAQLGLEPPELVPADSDDPRPWIPAGVMDVTKLRAKTWAAIRTLNEREPALLRQGNNLVRIKWPQDGGSPQLAMVTERNDLPSLLQDAGRWYVLEKPARGQPAGPKIRTDARPPEHVLIDVLKELDPPVPPLDYVLSAPAILPGGVLLATSGYFPEHGIAMALPPELEGITVPERPTSDEGAAALAFLRELLSDFPFQTPWDEANAIGLMLTPFLRPAINSFVPPFLITANLQGAGKTNLGHTLLRPALGDKDFYLVYEPKEDERRKQLATTFRDGEWIFGWDNITGAFKSSILASLVTTKNLKLRILGSAEQVTAPTGVVAVLTGNGIQMDADMMERAARIRLNVLVERPSSRPVKSFKHPMVWDEVLRRRKEVVEAILTVALRYWAAEDTEQDWSPSWIAGRSPRWSRHIHGALEASGWPAVDGGRGYSEGYEEAREADELEDGPKKAFAQAWWDAFKDTPQAPKTLFTTAQDTNLWLGTKEDASAQLRYFSQTVLPQLDGMPFTLEDEHEQPIAVQLKRFKLAKRTRAGRTQWVLEPIDPAKRVTDDTASPRATHGSGQNTYDSEREEKTPMGVLGGDAVSQVTRNGAPEEDVAPAPASRFGDMTGFAM